MRTQAELASEATRMVSEYLSHVDVEPPKLTWITGPDYGWYDTRTRTVAINLGKIRLPPVRPSGRMQSYPGSKTDRTVVGVMAHEVGHHLHNVKWGMGRASEIWGVVHAEPPVSSYEPNPGEMVAEACRLMITNPMLLAYGRPIRFGMLCSWGITPAHATPWREVLADADPQILDWCEKWALRGNRKKVEFFREAGLPV